MLTISSVKGSLRKGSLRLGMARECRQRRVSDRGVARECRQRRVCHQARLRRQRYAERCSAGSVSRPLRKTSSGSAASSKSPCSSLSSAPC